MRWKYGFLDYSLIGLIQLILSIIAIFQNDKKKLLFLFTCENIGYILIYLISGSFAGSALVFHATIRTTTYYLLSKYKNKIPTPVFIIFLLSAYISSINEFIFIISTLLSILKYKKILVKID